MSNIVVDMNEILGQGYPCDVKEEYSQYAKAFDVMVSYSFGEVCTMEIKFECDVDTDLLPDKVTEQMVGDTLGVAFCEMIQDYVQWVKK